METPEVETLRQVYAALNRNDIRAMVAHFDPQIAWIEPAGYADATFHGRATVEAHLTKARGSWVEGTCEPERFFVAGDKVVVVIHVRVRAKQSTEWVEGRHAAVYTFRDGKAIEQRIIDDIQEALDWAGVESTT